MKNFIDFLKHFSKSCLKQGYAIKSDIDSNFVYSFFLTHNGKRINYTNKFDGTFLENCQKTCYETSNLHITAIELSKELLTRIAKKYLSKDGIKVLMCFKK